MKAERIIHRNEARIRVSFPYDAEKMRLLRQIPDARWSKTHDAWHIPYTKQAFEQLIDLFPDVQFDKKEEAQTDVKKTNVSIPETVHSENAKEASPPLSAPNETNLITVQGKRIIVKIPKNDTDTQFLISFGYVRFDKQNKHWIIPNYGKNLELLQSYFANRSMKLIYEPLHTIQNTVKVPVEAEKLKTRIIQNRIIRIYFSYNKTIIDAVKQIGISRWHSSENCWTVPYTEQNLTRIKEIALANNLQFENTLTSKTKGVPRQPRHANYRRCPEAYTEKLKELRYSPNTQKVYADLFEEFTNYYADKKPEDITEDEIIAFLRYLVNERKISTSYQNQSINSIKFFYERVLGQSRKIYLIERPRKEKFLPEVLSEEEITALLKAITNLKHKALIMTIYSGGLRIGELVNLKVKDIDSDRMQIRISQSKGKKDRYTLLSKKTLIILRQYFTEYKPKEWLFEGENGGQYSTSSIYSIFTKALKQARITKKVSIHSLRHSFATHLLENGTGLRYIQSLLGHSSSKTTEIYTHITTKGFDQIKNPLDKMDV